MPTPPKKIQADPPRPKPNFTYATDALPNYRSEYFSIFGDFVLIRVFDFDQNPTWLG